MQLHQPREEGLDKFWVDFNLGSASMSLYTEAVLAPDDSNDAEDIWESVIVRNDVVKEWNITREV